MRFADKPTESSLCCFSADLTSVSEESRRVIQQAENWSLLLRIPKGQRDRNSNQIDSKYQLNSMLAPQWDLPIYRRGAVGLGTDEVDAVFDREFAGKFKEVLRIRVERMTAPRFGKGTKSGGKHVPQPEQPSLPGFDND
jgi:hypothetical protein